jgi:GNAT superfamily N-acetyltransferase
VYKRLGRRGDHGDRGSIDIGVLTPMEWRQLRTARLRALQDSPEAFLSEYQREFGWSEREWLAMFDSSLWVIARGSGRIVGLARSSRNGAAPWQRHVESVWVEPRFRRRGITRRLMEALIEHERRADVSELVIWVIEGNDRARRAWKRFGFRPTGERQLLPGGGGRGEERLLLRIDDR